MVNMKKVSVRSTLEILQDSEKKVRKKKKMEKIYNEASKIVKEALLEKGFTLKNKQLELLVSQFPLLSSFVLDKLIETVLKADEWSLELQQINNISIILSLVASCQDKNITLNKFAKTFSSCFDTLLVPIILDKGTKWIDKLHLLSSIIEQSDNKQKISILLAQMAKKSTSNFGRKVNTNDWFDQKEIDSLKQSILSKLESEHVPLVENIFSSLLVIYRPTIVAREASESFSPKELRDSGNEKLYLDKNTRNQRFLESLESNIELFPQNSSLNHSILFLNRRESIVEDFVSQFLLNQNKNLCSSLETLLQLPSSFKQQVLQSLVEQIDIHSKYLLSEELLKIIFDETLEEYSKIDQTKIILIRKTINMEPNVFIRFLGARVERRGDIFRVLLSSANLEMNENIWEKAAVYGVEDQTTKSKIACLIRNILQREKEGSPLSLTFLSNGRLSTLRSLCIHSYKFVEQIFSDLFFNSFMQPSKEGIQKEIHLSLDFLELVLLWKESSDLPFPFKETLEKIITKEIPQFELVIETLSTRLFGCVMGIGSEYESFLGKFGVNHPTKSLAIQSTKREKEMKSIKLLRLYSLSPKAFKQLFLLKFEEMCEYMISLANQTFRSDKKLFSKLMNQVCFVWNFQSKQFDELFSPTFPKKLNLVYAQTPSRDLNSIVKNLLEKSKKIPNLYKLTAFLWNLILLNDEDKYCELWRRTKDWIIAEQVEILLREFLISCLMGKIEEQKFNRTMRCCSILEMDCDNVFNLELLSRMTLVPKLSLTIIQRITCKELETDTVLHWVNNKSLLASWVVWVSNLPAIKVLFPTFDFVSLYKDLKEAKVNEQLASLKRDFKMKFEGLEFNEEEGKMWVQNAHKKVKEKRYLKTIKYDIVLETMDNKFLFSSPNLENWISWELLRRNHLVNESFYYKEALLDFYLPLHDGNKKEMFKVIFLSVAKFFAENRLQNIDTNLVFYFQRILSKIQQEETQVIEFVFDLLESLLKIQFKQNRDNGSEPIKCTCLLLFSHNVEILIPSLTTEEMQYALSKWDRLIRSSETSTQKELFSLFVELLSRKSSLDKLRDSPLFHFVNKIPSEISGIMRGVQEGTFKPITNLEDLVKLVHELSSENREQDNKNEGCLNLQKRLFPTEFETEIPETPSRRNDLKRKFECEPSQTEKEATTAGRTKTEPKENNFEEEKRAMDCLTTSNKLENSFFTSTPSRTESVRRKNKKSVPTKKVRIEKGDFNKLIFNKFK